MPQLRQIAYVSSIAPGMTRADERQLIGMAKRQNRGAGFTGFLASSGRHFLQILEGTRRSIDELIPKIQADSRHHDVRILFDVPITIREYASWTMGYIFSPDLADELGALHMGDHSIDVKALLRDLSRHEMSESVISFPSSFGTVTRSDRR